jgi:glycosyltransferase involved in cell wall biosynthesis
MNHPKVSICCITYNHEQFISQALDSFLMQETDFPYEIVIGDDCSTDNTPRIIEQYRQKYPDIIRVLERKKNLGSEINFVKTIEACHGEYVALCDGDDYWIAPNKLAKQSSFLDSNGAFNFCCHRSLYYDMNSDETASQYVDIFDNIHLKEITIENFLNPFIIPTNSILFRNLNTLIPAPFNKEGIKDIFLFSLLLKEAKGICFKEEMSVYRIHSTGIWSTISTLDKLKSNFYTAKKMFTAFDKNHKHIHDFIFRTAVEYIKIIQKNKKFKLELILATWFVMKNYSTNLSKWERKKLINNLFI